MPDLTGHLTARTGDGHAPPLSLSGKVVSLTFILLSPPVSFPALGPIEPQASPLVVLPRQFLLVSPLRAYFPGGALNSFPTALIQLKALPTPSTHRLRPGLPGYLIPFAPLAFVPHRQACSSLTPSPLVVPQGLSHFTATPGVPQTFSTL